MPDFRLFALLMLVSGCTINLKDAGPQVQILTPVSGETFTTTDKIAFSGEILADDVTTISLSSWSIGASVYDAEVGVGGTVGMEQVLGEGEYTVTLAAELTDGSAATDTIRIVVIATDTDQDGVPDTDDCAPENPDYSSRNLWYGDSDGDGYGDALNAAEFCEPGADYVTDSSDCDDAAYDVHPGSSEICNGIDDDCDGQIDEPGALGERTWYPDSDGDGYGPTGVAGLTACDAPDGYATETNDCDDADLNYHPYAEESCGGPDYNCDGIPGLPKLYSDDDEDGHGDPDLVVVDSTDPCAQPRGTSLIPDDCDDGDPTVYTGALELCDGIDNNCDGNVDEDDANRPAQYWRDADGDGYGGMISTQSCKPSNASYIAQGGDCEDDGVQNPNAASINPAAIEICDPSNVDEDCDTLIDDADPSVDTSTYLLWFDDKDQDTYGGSGKYAACDAPTGTVSDNTDCDDARGDVNPGAPEVCDLFNEDEDCDGLSDDNDPSATNQTLWYQDTDGDTYGSSVNQTLCDAPLGYVGVPGDCNDANNGVNPGVASDTCDSVDSDCDGVEDENAAVDTYEVNNGDPATAYLLLNGGTTASAIGNVIQGETEDWYRVYFKEDNTSTNVSASFSVKNLPTGCTMDVYLWDEQLEKTAGCAAGLWPSTIPTCLGKLAGTLSKDGTLAWTGDKNTHSEDTFLLHISCPTYTSGQCGVSYTVGAKSTSSN